MRSIGGGAESGLAAYRLAADTPAAAVTLDAASTAGVLFGSGLEAGAKWHTIHLFSTWFIHMGGVIYCCSGTPEPQLLSTFHDRATTSDTDPGPLKRKTPGPLMRAGRLRFGLRSRRWL